MRSDADNPSNAEILTALQGMWRQQRDLVKGLETRLEEKVDQATERLDTRLRATVDELGKRLAQEIQDRPGSCTSTCRE
jgi:hypothetical protein